MCTCVCMCISVHHLYVVSAEARKGHQSPETEVPGSMGCRVSAGDWPGVFRKSSKSSQRLTQLRNTTELLSTLPHVIIISLKKNDKHDLWRICSNSQQQGCCCSCWYAYSFLLLNTKRQVFLTCYVFSQVNFCVFIDLCTPVKPNCKYTLANMSPS